MTLELSLSIASTAISGIAVGVTVYYAHTTGRMNKELLALEKEKRTSERRAVNSAQLVAFMSEPDSQTGSRNLVIQNQGNSSAVDVVASIDGHPIEECDFIIDPEHTSKIGPKADADFIVVRSCLSDRTTFNVLVTWSDASGDRGRFETTLRRY